MVFLKDKNGKKVSCDDEQLDDVLKAGYTLWTDEVPKPEPKPKAAMGAKPTK